jgi:hypothetical protein
VRRVSGRHAKQPAPDYASCGITKTYTHLRAGTYTLYLKALSGGVASAVTTRTFRVGAK